MRLCPGCGADLTELDAAAEMGSSARRYDCHECALWFVVDAADLITEVDEFLSDFVA